MLSPENYENTSKQSLLASGLRELIREFTTGEASESTFLQLFRQCQSLAYAHLMLKISKGTLRLSATGLSHRDIAVDTIADLFSRDELGHYPQLRAYFSALDLDKSTEEELLAHLRRLISSKVNQGLFRLINEIDPVTGKILRNVKLAIKALSLFQEFELAGETWIVPSAVDALDDLPAFSEADLYLEFSRNARSIETTPDLLSKLSSLLRMQDEHRRAIPLMTAVYVIRQIITAPLQIGEGKSTTEEAISREEIREMIRSACEFISSTKRAKYISTKCVDHQIYESYFHVIEGCLVRELVEFDKNGFTYYVALKEIYPDLTEHQYRRIYKTKIEYLGRLARDETLRRIRRG